MTSVLGYARTQFIGGRYRAEPLPDSAAEVERFHAMIAALAAHLERGDATQGLPPRSCCRGPSRMR